MSSGDSTPRSALDKPLHQLTEDDISQLTREDCRRYLKEKGMRRPSWNKSQAIQQVISLKALLEPAPDSVTGEAVLAPKKPCLPRQDTTNRVAVPSGATEKRAANEFQISISVEESAAPPKKDHAGHHIDQPAPDAELAAAAASPRVLRDSNLPVTQLTIFYSGKVNVYDDVSRDKARSLIQLAASPLNFLADSTSDATPVPQPFVSLPQCINTKASPVFLTSNLQPSQTVKLVDNGLLQREGGSMYKEGNQEGAASRKACVQRYLEKRKDRSRFKRKVGMSSPSSLDGYLNQRMVDIGLNEQSGHSDIYCSSSPLPSLPHFPTQCCPAGNTVGDLNLSANNTDGDEL